MGELSSNPAGVLIISDDTEFARTLTTRWQAGRNTPALTLAGSDVWSGSSPAAYELIIVGPVRKGRLASILASLERSPAPAVYVAADANAVGSIEADYPRLLVVPQRDGWPDSLLQLCGEVLRRMEAISRARRAEQIAVTSQRLATLGHYMIEMRHNVNNALTSVLGNADLLLADQHLFPAAYREQIETIHTMSLRLNEIMQRFSSLASEMRLAEKESQSETESSVRSLIPGF
jgi:signal transduction histidine kinase